MTKMYNKTMMKKYSTARYDVSEEDLVGVISKTMAFSPHPNLLIATHCFPEPYPVISQTMRLSLSTMDLLLLNAYPCQFGYAKFTILLTMIKEVGDAFTFTIGKAIPLTSDDGVFLPKSDIFSYITDDLYKYIELYEGFVVTRITIHVYSSEKSVDKTGSNPLNINERKELLNELLNNNDSSTSIKSPTALKIKNRNKTYAEKYITSLKSCATKPEPFLVADTETIMLNKVHTPYAAGVMMVHPSYKLDTNDIYSYFSEDYSTHLYDSFEKRSRQLLYDFIIKISFLMKQNPSMKTIYFHNFARFDGIFLLNHIALHHPNYTLKSLMRNSMLYELCLFEGDKMQFRFRDSLHLLPGSLDTLAKSLCRELGTKGSINYESVTLENLGELKRDLLDYMRQDILLLGGVMQKAQRLYLEHYNVDLVKKLTCSSLALTIFRTRYYDAEKNPIYIPNRNADRFIRSGYYGGHTDSYKKYGESLYYYDVNSLYPYIMKEYSIPGGKPVWHGNLGDNDIDTLFGFIEAFVKCPTNINKPFLPYRDKSGVLIFPTGSFVGVYYSEELKYAKKLGYQVLPISGYLFEERESPFKGYVSSLYSSRLQAKKEGNDAMSFVYKILMNSLYGRFGINPKSTKTEICDSERYNFLLKQSTFIDFNPLRDNLYMVSYYVNLDDDPSRWDPPKNTAVHISAAITANARIYMYQYISRDDCYYTDTDSIFISNPLPDDEISTDVLGKFKLEDKIKKGIFLAAKAYAYTTYDANNVIKFKGAAKDHVNLDWFQEQYEQPDRKILVSVKNKFSIDWKKQEVFEKETKYKLGINLNSKRINLPDGDSRPIEIHDESALKRAPPRMIKSLLKRTQSLETVNQSLISISKDKERERLSQEVGLDISEERARSEWTKETERLKAERRSGLGSQAQDHSGETDEWKDEGQSDRAKPLGASDVHETTTVKTFKELTTIKEEVKAKQPKLYDHKPSKKKKKTWKGNKPRGKPPPT
ncbi:hypothetical protein CASFOL_009585 [Castilleja foliolosa]|uniref:DNA polymerase n=1 Tax=Castilleja foliolosa TaxID=1961234 RepID=A0ABD3DWJ5_9LAMI